MLKTCSFLNEKFSAHLINLILTYISNSTGELKSALFLLQNMMLIEDDYQLARLKLTLDGYREGDTINNGLLQIIRQTQTTDAKKSYQCVKFIVALGTKSNACKEFLLKNATNWEWAVNWLKSKMCETQNSFYNWNLKNESNEDAEIKTFQRTKSAQRTLDDATALLNSTELEELLQNN
jgi:ubiquitin carboxyl-terminal hydrolase 9/24